MTQGSTENIVEVKAGANVYTVLLAIAVLALCISTFFVGQRLMGDAPNGYGMKTEDLFKPHAEYKAEVDAQAGSVPSLTAAEN